MESKFNFKSQICTTREQSERLLALGLKKETADMVYVPHYVNGVLKDYFEPKILKKKVLEYMLTDEAFKDYILAWSLDRLREMLNKSGVTISFVERDTSIIVERYGVFQNMCEIWDNVYDNICDVIEWLIKEGYFNKKYLI